MSNTISGRSQRHRGRGITAIPTIGPTAGISAAQQSPSAGLGTITSITSAGVPQVSVAGRTPMAALVVGQVTQAALLAAYAKGTQVLLTFVDGDLHQPVIVGVIVSPASPSPTTAKVDGRRVELTGQDEVVLTCGKASITLTRAGKVIIKGTYVSSGSQGVHRITGGSVQIN